MPSSGDGTGWDETLPLDAGLISDTGVEIRDLRKGLSLRLKKEHNPFATSSAGGEHRQGSAVAFFQTSFPSKRPYYDSSGPALDSADEGRLMVYETDSNLWFWNGSGWFKIVTKDADQIADGILTKDHVASGFTAGIYPYAVLEERTADGDDGGTLTAGSWQSRNLTDEVVDRGAITSLSSGDFILQDGWYRVRAKACAYKVGEHRIGLFNGTSPIAHGTVACSPTDSAVVTYSELEHEFEVSGGPLTLTLKHYCATTNAGDGLGHAAHFGVSETYARVEIWKLL